MRYWGETTDVCILAWLVGFWCKMKLRTGAAIIVLIRDSDFHFQFHFPRFVLLPFIPDVIFFSLLRHVGFTEGNWKYFSKHYICEMCWRSGAAETLIFRTACSINVTTFFIIKCIFMEHFRNICHNTLQNWPLNPHKYKPRATILRKISLGGTDKTKPLEEPDSKEGAYSPQAGSRWGS